MIYGEPLGPRLSSTKKNYCNVARPTGRLRYHTVSCATPIHLCVVIDAYTPHTAKAVAPHPGRAP